MKTKKIILIAVAVVVVVGAGIWFFAGSPAKHKVTYATANVSKGDISNSVTATGTIEPVTEVEVGTQVSGIIDKIHVDYNSVVTKGQLIAEMDRITLQSELASQQATYDGAKAEYEYQKKNYERSKGLHEKSLISDTDFEQALYNYQKAKSSYDSSKASLAKAERNLSYATITSPIDGVVISRDVEAGQTVASGFETPTLFTIAADLTQMQVVADVDEADIGGVVEGQRASFTVDAYPNDVFEGVVTQIRLGDASSTSSTSSTTTVVTYEVVISAPNPDLKLKPRLTANVTIYILDKKDVLSVPNKALRFTPEKPLIGNNDIVKDCEGEHKLWTREGTTFTAHPVEVGISNGISTEIISGIPEGTKVVTEGQPQVIFREIDGVKCEPIEELTINVPEEYSSKIIDMVTRRKGEMVKMENTGERINLEFNMPSRGIIGLRTNVLTASAGEAIMAHRFKEYQPHKGEIERRTNGSMIAMESGTAFAYAIDKLQDRGKFFIFPQDEVYAGQVVGEHSHDNDLVINVTKSKKLTNMRASGSDDKVRLIPPIQFSLEEALEYIKEDEYVEVTPKAMRMRKVILDEIERKRANKN